MMRKKYLQKNIIWTWGGGGITSYMVNAIHCVVANVVWLKSEGGLAMDITSSLENSKTTYWFLKVVFKRKKVPHFLNGIFHQFWEFMNFEDVTTQLWKERSYACPNLNNFRTTFSIFESTELNKWFLGILFLIFYSPYSLPMWGSEFRKRN